MASKTQDKPVTDETVVDEQTDEPEAKKEPRFLPLTDEESVWVAAHARPASAPCLCGCGELTKGRFFPGHDARLKERLRATLGERDTDAGSDEAQANAQAALATFGW